MFRTTAGIFLVLTLSVANGCCVQRCETGGQASSPFLHGGEGSCDSACGPQRSRGLIGCLRKLLTCGSGCGELYVDEWLNDPPDCCDPCDNCGNWIGPHGSNMGQPRPLHRGNLWGQRFEGNCCSECGMMGPEAGYHHEDGFHQDGIAWDPLAGKAPPRSEVAPVLAGAAPHAQNQNIDRSVILIAERGTHGNDGDRSLSGNAGGLRRAVRVR